MTKRRSLSERESWPHGAAWPDELLADAVRSAQQGDEEAFEAVYAALQPGLLRYLRVLVDTDAEDVASETWLQIARDLASFSGDWDKFRGWTASVARNRAMDHLRRMRRRPRIATPAEGLAEPVGDFDTALQAEERVATAAAIAMIASLPRDQAEAVLLRVVMGLDAPAAGKVLGKRAGAVRMAAYRGLRQLARQLEQAPPVEKPLSDNKVGRRRHSSQPGPDSAPIPSSSAQPTTVTHLRAPALEELR